MTSNQHSVALSRPDISQDDIDAVVEVLKSGHLSLGPKLTEFEDAFASYVGVDHAVAVNSGTSALHLMIRGLNIKAGDEVITTPFSFVASSNCALFEGALPVFVDIDPDTYCIDPTKIEAAITPKTEAIIAVDVFGKLADYDALEQIATKHNLALIEDSCEALGTQSGGRMAGSYGDCGIFGFYPNKQMTTGEGGMITTNNKELADLARSMRNQGRNLDMSFLTHERLGYNYRLCDINCALGLSQVKRIEQFVDQRLQVASWYKEGFANMSDDLHVPSEQTDTRVSWFVYVVRLADQYSETQRDQLIAYLREKGIGCRDYFPPIHTQKYYKDSFGYKNGDFPITEAISQRTIALPFYSSLAKEEVQTVCTVLQEGLATLS